MRIPKHFSVLVGAHALLVAYALIKYGVTAGLAAAGFSAINLAALCAPIAAHFALGSVGLILTLWMVGNYVPGAVEKIGASYLIFFFHFPSALSCLTLFVISGAASGVYVFHRDAMWDHLGKSLVQVGVLACTVTLVTGSIWAKAAWGIWWDMTDPRLMTVALMWLTYLAYLALRESIEDPDRAARFGAVFGVLAWINVPIVHFAIQWLGSSHHPFQVDLSAPEMVATRWVGVGSFFVLYEAMVRLRYRVSTTYDRLGEMDQRLVDLGV